MNSDKPFDVTGTSIVYENPWIKVREDKIRRKNAKQGIYGYLEVDQSTVIIAVNDQGMICLIESYRHPFAQWYWEFPGGGGDREDILLASKRELEEETGIVAQEFQELGRARVCNGLSNEWQVNVLARNIEYGDFTQQEDETRARKFVSIEELDGMIRKGQFQDNQSITALYMYKLWLVEQSTL